MLARLEFQIKGIVFVAATAGKRCQSGVCIQFMHCFHLRFIQIEIKNVDVLLDAFFVGRLWNNDRPILNLSKQKK